MAGGKKNRGKRGRSNSESAKSPSQSQQLKKAKQIHLQDNLSDNESIYLDAEDSDIESVLNENEEKLVSDFKMAASKSELVEALKEALKDPTVIELINGQMKTEITKLKTAVELRDQKISELEEKIEGLEMYGRRNGVRIFGIKEPESDNETENTDRLVLELAAKIGAEIPKFALGRSHRVGPKPKPVKGGTDPNTPIAPPANPRPIIVKFISHNFKVHLLQHKKNLKKLKGHKNIYINEDLTKERAEWAKRARTLKKQDKIKETWTRDGIIFVKNTDDTVDRVQNVRELEAIEKKFSLVVTIPKTAYTPEEESD